MFDAEATLSTVQTRQAPNTWTVYQATASYFVFRGLVYGIGGAFTLAISGLFVAMVGATTSDGWLVYWLITTFFAVVGLGFCLASFVYFKEMRTRGRRILVLTPEGFVERKDSGDRSWFSVEYAKIATIAMTAGSTRAHEVVVDMIFTMTNGRRVAWEIGLWFSPAAAIAQQIIQAHATYHAVVARPRESQEARTAGE